MKVEKIVGWIQGLNGTGNLFEISDNGKTYLATIWQDGTFRPISQESVHAHVLMGKGELQSEKIYSTLSDGPIQVTNASGWERLYVAPVPETGNTEETEIEVSDILNIPVSFTGTLKINISELSKLINILN